MSKETKKFVVLGGKAYFKGYDGIKYSTTDVKAEAHVYSNVEFAQEVAGKLSVILKTKFDVVSLGGEDSKKETKVKVETKAEVKKESASTPKVKEINKKVNPTKKFVKPNAKKRSKK